MAITPGGRVGDATPLGKKPGGKRRLTDYEREVAHALMRDHGYPESVAIAIAKSRIKRWAAGGGHVRPQVRVGAAKSVAESKALANNATLSGMVDLTRSDNLEQNMTAANVTLKRDIELGKDGSKWRHGYIPLNAVAVAMKKHKFRGGSDGAAKTAGKIRGAGVEPPERSRPKGSSNAKLRLKAGEYRGQQGHHITGTDTKGRKVAVFAPGHRASAETARDRIAAGGPAFGGENAKSNGATSRAVQVAQDRHRRIENARVAKAEDSVNKATSDANAATRKAAVSGLAVDHSAAAAAHMKVSKMYASIGTHSGAHVHERQAAGHAVMASRGNTAPTAGPNAPKVNFTPSAGDHAISVHAMTTMKDRRVAASVRAKVDKDGNVSGHDGTKIGTVKNIGSGGAGNRQAHWVPTHSEDVDKKSTSGFSAKTKSEATGMLVLQHESRHGSLPTPSSTSQPGGDAPAAARAKINAAITGRREDEAIHPSSEGTVKSANRGVPYLDSATVVNQKKGMYSGTSPQASAHIAKFKVGDMAVVKSRESGGSETVTKITASRSGDGGGFGSAESHKLSANIGPGRYTYDITNGALTSGSLNIRHATPEEATHFNEPPKSSPVSAATANAAREAAHLHPAPAAVKRAQALSEQRARNEIPRSTIDRHSAIEVHRGGGGGKVQVHDKRTGKTVLINETAIEALGKQGHKIMAVDKGIIHTQHTRGTVRARIGPDGKRVDN